MAYDVYTLTGYILESKDYSEYDKRIIMMSKENGIIEAVAISARKPASKMKSFLSRFLKISMDVVHGKTGYRITRTTSLDDGFVLYRKDSYLVMARFSKMLLAVLPYGVESPESYMVLDELGKYLQNNIVTENSSAKIFYIYSIKLLYSLGYTQKINNIESLSENDLRSMHEYILNENGLSSVI